MALNKLRLDGGIKTCIIKMMSDSFKREVKLPGCTAKESRGEDSKNVSSAYEEITTTKTEVIEESYDGQSADDIEFVDVNEMTAFEYFLFPEQKVENNNLVSVDIMDQPKNKSFGCKSRNKKNQKNIFENESCSKFEKEGGVWSSEFQKVVILNSILADVFVCSFCKLKILDRKQCLGHIEKCKNNYLREDEVGMKIKNIFKCDQCNYSAKKETQLQHHLLIHDSTKNLQKHTRTQSNRRESRFFCSHCNKSYVTKTGITLHIKKKHSKDQKHMCDT